MTTELLRDYQVKDFMSKGVASVTEETRASRAIELMVAREIGCLAVLGKAGPIGLFTERDLVTALTKWPDLGGRRVGDLMDVTISRTSPALRPQDAAREMTDTKGRLFVYEGGALVGIVTATDIVKVIWRMGVAFEIDEVISRRVVTAETKEPVDSVVRLMNDHSVGSVILTENEVPRGIFTERDLLNRVLYARLGLDQPVTKAATFPLVSAELGINGGEATHAMVARKVKRLPLMQDRKLAGIVTARDIVDGYAYPSESRKTDLEIRMAVNYGEVCPLCHTRIDDRGLCGCDTMGGG